MICLFNSLLNQKLLLFKVTIMSLLKNERSKDKFFDRSQALLEERKLNRNFTLSNQSRLVELEEKMKILGGL